jgi:hypothetical protein
MRDLHDALARDLGGRALKEDGSDVISLVHHMRRTGLELRLRPEPVARLRRRRGRGAAGRETLSPAA